MTTRTRSGAVRGVVLAALVAACGDRAAARAAAPVDVAPRPAAVTAIAPVEPPPPRVPGAWAARRVTAAPWGVGGLVVAGDGPILLAGDIGGGGLALYRLAGDEWRAEPIPGGAGSIPGAIGARGDALALTAIRVEMSPLTMTFEYRDSAAAAVETIASGCELPWHRLVVDRDRPLVLVHCGDDVHLYERVDGRWRVRATIPDVGPFDAAVDADGRVHLASNDRHWIVTGRDVAAQDVPEGIVGFGRLAACGGVVHASLEQRDAAGAALELGVWRDGGWQRDVVVPDLAGAFGLGFDQRCRPFPFLGDEVYAHDGARWVRSTIGGGREIKAIAGHGETLYAAYEEIRDGVHVGIAIAPLAAP